MQIKPTRLPAMPAATAVAVLYACALTWGCAADEETRRENAPSETPARVVALAGQPNFRDLGGYGTADGRTVKWREVFR